MVHTQKTDFLKKKPPTNFGDYLLRNNIIARMFFFPFLFSPIFFFSFSFFLLVFSLTLV